METINEKIKSSIKTLGEKITCSLEVLTPVHIGSGVKLTEGIDFIKNNYSVHIVPQAELMEYLESNPDEMENFIKGNYMLTALKEIPEGRKYNISIGPTKEINEFERNGLGNPYIPGSSLKGAIRTILLNKRFNELSKNEKENLLEKVSNSKSKKEFASEPILKELFGNDSNHNLMRVLEIFDVEFNELDLSKVLILSLTDQNGTSYGWKQLSKRQNTDDPESASQIICETLLVGSKGYFSISLNKFLFENPEAKNELKFNEETLKDFKNLVKVINDYSKQKLEEEIKFFENLTSPKKLQTLVIELNKILKTFNNLSNEEFVLRISWGSGWKGMTGDYLDNKWLSFFRNKYGKNKGMGNPGFPIFPKTRRIVFENDEPKYITGWIRVKLFDSKSQNQTVTKKSSENLSTDNPIDLLKQKFKVREDKKL